MQDLRDQATRRTREELLDHLNSFELDLKMAVGVWYFSPGGGRFHDRYVPDIPIEQRLEMAAEWASWGIRGIEAHYPLEVNEDNLQLYKQLEQQAGIRLTNVGPFIFFDKAYEFGSLSNPIDRNRQKAYDTLLGALRLVRDYGADHCGIWPGIDGYTYPLGTVFYEMWDRFEEAVASAMDEVPGVRVAIEPKPYEPAPNNIYRTTADGLLACHDIERRLEHAQNRKLLEQGHAMVAMQPEIGHVCMGFEDVPYAFARCAREGRLGNTHWNSQPLGNYDQDLDVGVVGWEKAEALLYLLKMIGYQGTFCFDINPERMPVEKAVEINCRVLRIMNDRINRLPHEQILDCYFDPENHRGDLELILAEARK
ncbi:MAG: sugar phosphate isomerase/epimerase family protein [Candidatus Brocadiia bacterium]